MSAVVFIVQAVAPSQRFVGPFVDTKAASDWAIRHRKADWLEVYVSEMEETHGNSWGDQFEAEHPYLMRVARIQQEHSPTVKDATYDGEQWSVPREKAVIICREDGKPYPCPTALLCDTPDRLQLEVDNLWDE